MGGCWYLQAQVSQACDSDDGGVGFVLCVVFCAMCVSIYAQADTVVFDDELSPGQLRNLEKAFTGGQGGKPVSAGHLCAAWFGGLQAVMCAVPLLQLRGVLAAWKQALPAWCYFLELLSGRCVAANSCKLAAHQP